MAEKNDKSERSKCRDPECSQTFSNKSNCDPHEKKAGHTPAARSDSILISIFSKELKEYCCPQPNCPLTSKYKSNITRPIKAGCQTLSTKENNNVCPHCKQTFAQKSKRDRHVKRFHTTEPEFSQINAHEDEMQVPTFDNDTADMMNVSILSSDGSTVIEQTMRVVDKETLIFEVFEPDQNQGPLESTIASAHQSDSVVSIPKDIPLNGNNLDDTDLGDDQSNFLQDLENRAKQQETDHEVLFRNKVLNKLKTDIKSRTAKRSTAKFLYESFDDSLTDYSFVCWPAKKLELKPSRLKEIVKNAQKTLLLVIQCLPLSTKPFSTFG